MSLSPKPIISIVVSYAYPYIGSGIGNVAQKQAELLAKNGYEVHLLSSNYPKSEEEFVREEVQYLKFPATYFLEKLHVPVPLTLLSLPALHIISKSDIVHVHDGMYISSFLAVLVAKLLGKKVVVTVHIGHIPYTNKLVNCLEYIAELVIAKPVFLLTDKIILINSSLKKDFSSYKEKVSVLSNGVDTDLFHPVSLQKKNQLRTSLGYSPKQKIVLFVGRLVPKKGFTLLFSAASSNYEIVFVGGGEIKDEYRQIPGTNWIGSVQPEKLAEYYQLSDVLVLPSYGEGYPLSIKEALASGIPVITTFKHDSLEKLVNKLVFTVNASSGDIKAKIEKIFASSGIEKYEKNRQEFLTQFSWTTNILNLELVYKKLLQK